VRGLHPHNSLVAKPYSSIPVFELVSKLPEFFCTSFIKAIHEFANVLEGDTRQTQDTFKQDTFKQRLGETSYPRRGKKDRRQLREAAGATAEVFRPWLTKE
jgi:hypothetical protein